MSQLSEPEWGPNHGDHPVSISITNAMENGGGGGDDSAFSLKPATPAYYLVQPVTCITKPKTVKASDEGTGGHFKSGKNNQGTEGIVVYVLPDTAYYAVIYFNNSFDTASADQDKISIKAAITSSADTIDNQFFQDIANKVEPVHSSGSDEANTVGYVNNQSYDFKLVVDAKLTGSARILKITANFSNPIKAA